FCFFFYYFCCNLNPKLMKKIISLFLFIAIVSFSMASAPVFYQLKVYHLKNQTQEKNLDLFLEKSYIPALHRANIKSVGVFKERIQKNSNDILLYVFIPFENFEATLSLEKTLLEDQVYLQTGKEYIEATINEPAYL